MSSAARNPPGSNGRGASARRLRLALAASAACHLGLSAILVSETPRQALYIPAAAPISVRLGPVPEAGPHGLTHPERVAPLEERAIQHAPAASDAAARQVSTEPNAGISPGADLRLAVPLPPDQTVFSAQDLDVYPAPVAPFDVDRVAARADGETAGEVRLEVLIDEHGRVNEIAFTEPRTLGATATLLRNLIAATRFVPARKDGRAVKSRVVLSVKLGAAQRDP